MLIEVISNDNGSEVNTTLSVYKCYNTQQKLFEVKRYCQIDEDDFLELLSEKEQDKYLNGKYIFNIPLSKIEEKAIY